MNEKRHGSWEFLRSWNEKLHWDMASSKAENVEGTKL